MPQRNTAGANTIEKFTGKEYDDEGSLNLDYFGARYYDPALGRWQSVDPMAKKYPAWSPYNYTSDNPLNLVDPDGMRALLSNTFSPEKNPPNNIYFDSKTGSVDIVRNDKPDKLYVDGKLAGGTDVSYWKKGANTYDSYGSMFATTFGDRLLDKSYYHSLMNGASRFDIKLGLLRARISVGGSRAMEVLGKSIAMGAGIFGAAVSGTGIAMGAADVIATGSYIGTMGNALNTGIAFKNENYVKGSLYLSGMAVSGFANYGIKQATTSLNFLNISNIGGKALVGNKLIMDQLIFSTIGAVNK